MEAMRSDQRHRWLELLSYLMALVYHDRSQGEHQPLQEMIERSVGSGRDREEVREMGKTMAEVLREEGEKIGEKISTLRPAADA